MAGRGDGGGAQAWATVLCISAAQAVGCRYAHTPVESVAHNRGRDINWSTNWEAFFNLGHEEVLSAGLIAAGANRLQLDSAMGTPPVVDGRGPLVVAARSFAAVCRLAPRSFAALQPVIHRKFCAGEGPASLQSGLDPAVLRIAAHVRRNDISDPKYRHTGRFIENGRFLQQLDTIRTLATEAGIQSEVHVISDGRADELQDLADFGCQVWLDEAPFTSLARIIQADIRVVGRSAFAYMGCLLGAGLVISLDRLPTGPTTGWITSGMIADWSTGDLLAQLTTALGADRLAALRATAPAVIESG
jgi:hypothetical protein